MIIYNRYINDNYSCYSTTSMFGFETEQSFQYSTIFVRQSLLCFSCNVAI